MILSAKDDWIVELTVLVSDIVHGFFEETMEGATFGELPQ
jgi:hypothetical protein